MRRRAFTFAQPSQCSRVVVASVFWHCYCCLHKHSTCARIKIMSMWWHRFTYSFNSRRSFSFLFSVFPKGKTQIFRMKPAFWHGLLQWEITSFGEFKMAFITKKTSHFFSLHFYTRDHRIESLLFHFRTQRCVWKRVFPPQQREYKFLSFAVTLETIVLLSVY